MAKRSARLYLWLNDATPVGTKERFVTMPQVRAFVAEMRPRAHPKPGGDVVVVRKGRTKVAELPAGGRRNPAVFVAGVSNPRGVLFSRKVLRVEYVHAKDGERYFHDFGRGARMEALPDGSIRLYNPDRPLWVDV